MKEPYLGAIGISPKGTKDFKIKTPPIPPHIKHSGPGLKNCSECGHMITEPNCSSCQKCGVRLIK